MECLVHANQLRTRIVSCREFHSFLEAIAVSSGTLALSVVAFNRHHKLESNIKMLIVA